jgi:hypothetical protein
LEGELSETESNEETPYVIDESKFSFDLDALAAHLPRGDDFAAAIRGHLYLEHILMTFIQSALQRPDAVNLDRLHFPVKVDLAIALGLLPEDLAPPLKKVNSFRNKVAHNLKYQMSDTDRKELYDSFSPLGKQLIDESVQRGKVFSAELMVKVITTLLEVQRQHYVDWKMKREAALKKLADRLKS